jgi:plasmid stabilization system protein ParE
VTPTRRRSVLVIHEDAEADIDEAVTWYAGQRAGLGVELIHAIDVCLQSVRRFPQARRIVLEDLDPPVRRSLVQRFPYSIYYVAVPGAVHVLGCLNQHRDSDDLRKQIEGRARNPRRGLR